MTNRSQIAVMLAIPALLVGFAGRNAAAANQGGSEDSKVAQVDVLCPTSDARARELYNAGVQLQSERKWDEAIASYRKAADRDGRYCDAMDNLGLLLRKKGELAEAITWYKRSLAVKPDNQSAHLNLAVAYRFQKNLDEAQTQYLWLIRHAPSNPEGFYGLGSLLQEKGKDDEAIEKLLVAERLYLASGSPYVTDARLVLGSAYYRKQEWVKAREYLLQAYPEAKDDVKVNYMLGVCYLDPQTGDKEKATGFLLKAKSLGAKLPPAMLDKLEP